MIHKNFDDLPPYDAVQFEEQRLARAKEFAKAVKSLTRFDMANNDDKDDKWVMRGASYQLPDGQDIEVMRQGFFVKPESSKSAAKVMTPWTEHLGMDGLRRRVRLTRYVAIHVAPDIDWGAADDLDDDLPEPPESLKRATEEWVTAREKENFLKRIDSSYRPPELIDAKSGSVVEVKLKQGPNWRTERQATLTNQDTILSNLSARRQAGEEVEQRDYSVQEHEDLMRLLKSIKTNRIKPTELPLDIF